ncbi:hypothetical protein POPTR_005G247051v4 [Populus trichocarpa]|uniref:Uncharacterized protein n=1 Tax=Populus trichocarpa TaxID=3694 RepID=A0ACC0T1V6_POPTR|nr:hypothetical protein POPTR_005G247051v4 [Populus trichocarpa]
MTDGPYKAMLFYMPHWKGETTLFKIQRKAAFNLKLILLSGYLLFCHYVGVINSSLNHTPTSLLVYFLAIRQKTKPLVFLQFLREKEACVASETRVRT